MTGTSTDKRFRNNALITVVALSVVMLVLNIGSVGWTMFVDGDAHRQKAKETQLGDTSVSALRGTIYDANMNVLVNSSYSWTVEATPKNINLDETRLDIAENLSRILSLDYDEVLEKLSKKESKYELIKKNITAFEKSELDAFLEGGRGYSRVIYCTTKSSRYYSNGTLASSVLGATNADNEGVAGLELYYNESLSGTPGRIVGAKDAKGNSIESEYETVIDPVQGNGLVLTIDSTIQYYLEKALREGTADADATGAYGIVMDVDTGAILAMANMPEFDPNDAFSIYDEYSINRIVEAEKKRLASEGRENDPVSAITTQWKNWAVSDSYEPGSVFKTVTLSAALEESLVSDSTTYSCGGSIKIAGNQIHCVKRSGHGGQSLVQGLMNSCNPFFVYISQKFEPKTFFEYFEAFGFTEKTGIDLPSEFSPKAGTHYHPGDKYTIANLASYSFGQSFRISPIQLITALSAIANGGTLMQPYVVQAKVDMQGNVLSTTEPVAKRQVISESTSAKVREMMEKVVSEGTGKNAYIPGYHVAGKTATSQKLDDVDETATNYVASFGCFAPADDPEIAILIVVNEPRGAYHSGGVVAAPIAREVMRQSLTYLNVLPEYSDSETASLGSTAPNLVGRDVSGAKQHAANQGFSTKVVGSGSTVISQMPVENTSIPANGVIVLYTEETEGASMVAMPDFSGKSVSAVNSAGIAAGVNIVFSGPSLTQADIVSYKQSVAAGTMVEAGSSVMVYFHSTVNTDD